MSVLDKNKNFKNVNTQAYCYISESIHVYMEDVQTDIKPNRSVKCSIINEYLILHAHMFLSLYKLDMRHKRIFISLANWDQSGRV